MRNKELTWNSLKLLLISEADYFYCDQCDYKCKYKQSLKYHIEEKHEEHTEANFSCEDCGLSFTFQRNLTVHRR